MYARLQIVLSAHQGICRANCGSRVHSTCCSLGSDAALEASALHLSTEPLGIWSPKYQRKETYCQDHETTNDCCPGCRITAKFDAVPSKIEGGNCHHQNEDRLRGGGGPGVRLRKRGSMILTAVMIRARGPDRDRTGRALVPSLCQVPTEANVPTGWTVVEADRLIAASVGAPLS